MSNLAAIDDATLYAFLDAKWGGNSCEVCGVKEWSLGRTADMPWAAVPLVNAQNHMSSAYWAVVPVMCGNCGNTKHLYTGAVEAWAATTEGKSAIEELRKLQLNV